MMETRPVSARFKIFLRAVTPQNRRVLMLSTCIRRWRKMRSWDKFDAGIRP